jgi:hypothetical protein
MSITADASLTAAWFGLATAGLLATLGAAMVAGRWAGEYRRPD